MPGSHAVVTFEAATGLPEDRVVNTFSFFHTASVASVAGTIQSGLEAFYNTDHNVLALASYLSDGLSRLFNGVTVDVYDITANLGGSPHGVPTSTDTFDLAPSSGQVAMPSEVAMCLTLIGLGRDLVSPDVPDDGDPSGVDDDGTARDRPMQRRTGRIYFGPLNLSAITGTGARPSTGLRSDLLAAGDWLHAFLAANNITWAVWSRQNEQLYAITGAFVDDAFDTQRRRGLSPTVRTSTVF